MNRPALVAALLWSAAACASAPPAPAPPPAAVSSAAPRESPTPSTRPTPAPVPPAPPGGARVGGDAGGTETGDSSGGSGTGAASDGGAGTPFSAGAGGVYAPPPRSPDDTGAGSRGAGPPVPQAGSAGAVPASPSSGDRSGRGVTLTLAARPASARVGDSVTIEVGASASTPVVDAPLHLLYDPGALSFVDASEGEFMRRDGAGTVFLVNGLSRPGDVVIGIGRSDRSRGASGSGPLCSVRFRILAAGIWRVTIGSAMAWDAGGSLLPVATAATEIQVPR